LGHGHAGKWSSLCLGEWSHRGGLKVIIFFDALAYFLSREWFGISSPTHSLSYDCAGGLNLWFGGETKPQTFEQRMVSLVVQPLSEHRVH
jgi:hypothetical protein